MMIWLLIWLNVSIATSNTTLQLLVIYRCTLQVQYLILVIYKFENNSQEAYIIYI